uniref:tRNA (adenine(58)-N(1))-methyltransferase non-catalytic subunit TRM6 n=1 Tax=Saccoglossus kowalevskii TaxID=10224 RepID=A0ABM0MHL4_SACKO|nr:PREDICTED: tRNA (adenine(58)-N(1))-methyltransferase non-catalytic subunit TRM6-like [Saccoglossus kowalevskii]
MSLASKIKEDDYVILQKGKNMQLVQVRKKRKIHLDRKFFDLDPAIGESYGTTWEITKRTITKVYSRKLSVVKEESTGSDAVGDNRNIVDDNTAQKLSHNEILALKKDGLKGEDLIGQIVENSATFKEKNIYSQAKYIKKKKDKHIPIFKILKPTTRLLCEMYYTKASPKIVFIRYDTMGQILTFGNIHANMKVIVVESCMGLLLGAVMDRMGGYGTVVQLYIGDSPLRIATDGYNFPKEYYKTLHSFPLNQAGSLKLNTESELKEEYSTSPKNTDCQCSGDEKVKKQRTDSPSNIFDDNSPSNDAIVLAEKNDVMAAKNSSGDFDKKDTPKKVETSPSVQDDDLKCSNSEDKFPNKDALILDEKDERMDVNNSCDDLVEKNTPEKLETSPLDTDASKCSESENNCPKISDKKNGDSPACIDTDDKVFQNDGIIEEDSAAKDTDDNDAERGLENNHSGKGKRKRVPYPERVARKEKRKQELEDARFVIESGHFDAVLIACKFDPAPILLKLLEFLSPSRPFIVYCTLQPLYECFGKIRESKETVNVKITESWLREYQVLPMRTHPLMNMSGTGGYILTGIKVNT